jgi:ubiquinone/menaquinone biosynthesis C-methylase UbiE
MTDSDYEARTREVWKRAASFPVDKEAYYREHGLVQEFDLHQGKKVLEYGCGGGSDTMSFLRRRCDVTYVDVVASNVSVTADRLRALMFRGPAEGCTLEQGDVLPFPDASFDVVSAHGVLHHIPEAIPVVREFYRVLRPSGLLYVMLYTEGYFKELQPRIAQLQRDKHLSFEEAAGWCTDAEGVPYSRFYTEEQGKGLLEKDADFRVLQAPLWNRGCFRTFKAERL